ncbi:hypothetical protein GCM10010954_35260 [Halobacillus andaensis]|uniref:Anaphase-promoting complex subunit 4-like WD40 domain-containing protein n=1 Tax=Halobacillus andaensis TaxID=1176239 RepID=A0A917BBT2_HALAA|nr:hypothetical protein [Halobacillus andaensis]MBP2005633.1 WD40 repeat protein [Halobacillus andaensis]GGF33035.1 hypothetical protein GCM10010954_35260 [Halobacillus andaensis]
MIIQSIKAHSSHVNQLKYHPEERFLLSAGFNGELFLWDVDTQEKIQEYNGHLKTVNCIQWIENGRKLISASGDGKILMHEVSASSPFKSWQDLKSGVSHLRFTYDGRYLLTSDKSSMLRVREWPEEDVVQKLKSDQQNSGVLATASQEHHAIIGGVGPKLRRFLIPSGEVLEEFEGHEQATMKVEFFDGDRHGVSAGYDGRLILWDMQAHQKLESYSIGNEGYYTIAISPDEKEVAIAMPYRLTRVQLDNLKMQHYDLPAKGNYCVDYLPGGKQLAIASADKTIKLVQL